MLTEIRGERHHLETVDAEQIAIGVWQLVAPSAELFDGVAVRGQRLRGTANRTKA